jgi:hypothetical protein
VIYIKKIPELKMPSKEINTINQEDNRSYKRMEKKVHNDDVYYRIIWSKPNQYTRHTVMGIPSTAGIVSIFQEERTGMGSDLIITFNFMLFYACWKSGVRNGSRDLLDPDFSQFPELIKLSEEKKLFFRYSVIDTHSKDMLDIMYWLINEYQPSLNKSGNFLDSQRYKNIYIKELFEK